MRQEAGRPDDRGVLAMRCAERLVHVDVGEFRQVGAERRVALGLPALEAEVLEHEDVAG